MSYTKHEQEIIKALAFLAALYPRYQLEDATIQAYVRILRDLPAERVQVAVEHLGATSVFFPSAAEIRKAAFDLAMIALDVPSAYEAWQQVKSFRRDLHPLAQKAIDLLGGLGAFGQSDVDDEPSWRARFISCYETLVKRERTDVEMLPEVQDYVQVQASKSHEAIKALAAKLSGNGREDQ